MKKWMLTLVLAGCQASSLWAATASDVAAARAVLVNDYQKVGNWFSQQLSDTLAYNATSGTNLPANVCKVGGFEVGVTVGATASEIDTNALSSLGAGLVDTSQVKSYSRLPVPVGIAHVKVGLPWGLDLGGKFGTYTLGLDKDGTDFSFKNRVWGLEVRKSIFEDGVVKPFGLAVGVSLDGNDGEVEMTDRYTTVTSYNDGSTNFTATPDVNTRLKSDAAVRSLGMKAVVSKNLVVATPFLGIGLNKNFGKVTTSTRTDGTLTLAGGSGGPAAETFDQTTTSDDKADDVDSRIFAGVELNFFVLKLGLSAEYAGKDVAANLGLRFQFR